MPLLLATAVGQAEQTMIFKNLLKNATTMSENEEIVMINGNKMLKPKAMADAATAAAKEIGLNSSSAILNASSETATATATATSTASTTLPATGVNGQTIAKGCNVNYEQQLIKAEQSSNSNSKAHQKPMESNNISNCSSNFTSNSGMHLNGISLLNSHNLGGDDNANPTLLQQRMPAAADPQQTMPPMEESNKIDFNASYLNNDSFSLAAELAEDLPRQSKTNSPKTLSPPSTLSATPSGQQQFIHVKQEFVDLDADAIANRDMNEKVAEAREKSKLKNYFEIL